MAKTVENREIVKAYLAHRDGLFGFILALTRDRAAAEEVFQDTGLAVLEEAAKGVEVARFLPWVHEIIRRRVAGHFRKVSRLRAFEAPSAAMLESVSLAFQEQADDPELNGRRRAALEHCVDTLGGRSRELVRGFYREGKSIRDLAKALDWTENAVKVALWKVRRALADCVRGRIPEEAP